MNSLYYAGMVGILDPPREGCRESIDAVESAGVNVKMITGDAIETACSIGMLAHSDHHFNGCITGARLHLFRPGDTCLSGQQVDEMSDMELEQVIRSVVVFYRASPRHKLKIVKVRAFFKRANCAA